MKQGALRLPVRSVTLADLYVAECLDSVAFTVVSWGIYFWARARCGFDDATNLVLGTLLGLVYTACAVLGGRLADKVPPVPLVCTAGCGMGLAVAAIPLLASGQATFLFTSLFVGLAACTWPAIESAIVHHPGRLTMPARLGLYNVGWALTATLSMAGAAWLFVRGCDWVLWASTAASFAMVLWLGARYRVRVQEGSAAMDLPHRGAEVPAARKRRFMILAWVANSLAYAMLGAFGTLAPHVGERLGLRPAAAMLLTSVPLLVRAIWFAVLLRWEGWHYRAGGLVAALLLGPLFLAVVFFGPGLWAVAVAMAGFAGCIGLSYYSSIYYSIDAGEEKGAHAGLHEGIIGIGTVVGPLVGVLGTSVGGGTQSAKAAVVLLSGVASIIAAGWFLAQRERHPGASV